METANKFVLTLLGVAIALAILALLCLVENFAQV